MHAVVARSTFPSQNVQNTCVSEYVWKLRCRKVDAVVTQSTFRSQHVQNTSVSEQVRKVKLRKNTHRYARETHFQVKMYKIHHVRTTFKRSNVVSRGRYKRLYTLSKISKICKKNLPAYSSFNYNTITTTTLQYTPFYSTTLQNTAPQLQ